MSHILLQAVGESFANISGAIAECVTADVQNVALPIQHFEDSLEAELRRLRSLGMDGLAEVLGAMRPPLSRLMREGW